MYKVKYNITMKQSCLKTDYLEVYIDGTLLDVCRGYFKIHMNSILLLDAGLGYVKVHINGTLLADASPVYVEVHMNGIQLRRMSGYAEVNMNGTFQMHVRICGGTYECVLIDVCQGYVEVHMNGTLLDTCRAYVYTS